MADQKELEGLKDVADFSGPNTSRYLEMQQPHESMSALDEATKAFFVDVAKARVKHRMTDVHVIMQANVKTESGGIGSATSSIHLGSELNAEGMIAFSLGREQRARQERIADLLSKAMPDHRRRQKGESR